LTTELDNGQNNSAISQHPKLKRSHSPIISQIKDKGILIHGL